MVMMRYPQNLAGKWNIVVLGQISEFLIYMGTAFSAMEEADIGNINHLRKLENLPSFCAHSEIDRKNVNPLVACKIRHLVSNL